MTPITQETVALLKEKVTRALAPLGEEYGMEIHAAKLSFTSTEINFKLKLTDIQASWAEGITGTSLLPSDLGKDVVMDNIPLRIAGYNASAHQKKIVLKDRKGNRYPATISQTLGALVAADPTRKNSPTDARPEPETIESQFDMKASVFGLKDRISYGQTFLFGQETFRIVDLNTKSTKHPIVAESIQTGHKYRFGMDILKEDNLK